MAVELHNTMRLSVFCAENGINQGDSLLGTLCSASAPNQWCKRETLLLAVSCLCGDVRVLITVIKEGVVLSVNTGVQAISS